MKPKPDLYDHYDEDYRMPDSDPPPPAKPDWLMIGLLLITLGSPVWWLFPHF